MHVYSINFYRLLGKHLIRGGVFVTQATSPYFSPKAFRCLIKTIDGAGFSVLPYHNQIPTMGEWGWVLGSKADDASEEQLKIRIMGSDFSRIPSRFINNDAIMSMIHFGKGTLSPEEMGKIEINTEMNPVLHRYYMAGSWGMY